MNKQNEIEFIAGYCDKNKIPHKLYEDGIIINGCGVGIMDAFIDAGIELNAVIADPPVFIPSHLIGGSKLKSWPLTASGKQAWVNDDDYPAALSGKPWHNWDVVGVAFNEIAKRFRALVGEDGAVCCMGGKESACVYYAKLYDWFKITSFIAWEKTMGRPYLPLKYELALITYAYLTAKKGAYAVWVVGEYRNKEGNYVNFVGNTITAFLRAGWKYYNEGIFLTPLGSAPMRANKQFMAAQKLVKVHQNILVFRK